MKQCRVFQLCGKDDDEAWDLVAEFELMAQPDIPGLYSLENHKEVTLEDGQTFEIMCEMTRYGNYLNVNQGTVNVLSLKADGNFAVSFNLEGGSEIHIDTAE
jgi:hypothetical protein